MKLLFLFLFMSSTAQAMTNEQLDHAAAHVGMSFAFQTGFYGINNRWIGLSKPWSEGLAFVETMAIGFAYKSFETNPPNTGTAMLENGFGALGAVATHVTFEF